MMFNFYVRGPLYLFDADNTLSIATLIPPPTTTRSLTQP